MRSPVLALRPCGLVVCSSLTLSVRSAPSSWRGVDAWQRVGGGAWSTQAHRLRLTGPCPLDQDGGENEKNEFRLQKNIIVVELSESSRFRPLLHDAFCATHTPGDCTAVSTPPARGHPPPCTCVWAGSSPTRGAVATPSTLGLFSPKRTFRCHKKQWANIHVRI